MKQVCESMVSRRVDWSLWYFGVSVCLRDDDSFSELYNGSLG
jgi:hypothetical protein